MSYLEQSTRYIPYDDQPQGAYRYHVPAELTGALRERYVATLDRSFDIYRVWLPQLRAFFEQKFPRDPAEAEGVYRTTIRAKALDTLRGLLPAATTSNVGIYGTGQGYEQLLLRMRAHPLREVRVYADLMLVELRKVIPAFLKRVDVAARGGAGGLRRQAAQSASPAGPGIRADVVSLRRARRLRRVSRPAAPPAAHARVAAAHAAPRPRRARRDRRRGRGRRLEPRDGRIGEAARRDRGGRSPGGRVVRRGDGVSRALLHGDERP